MQRLSRSPGQPPASIVRNRFGDLSGKFFGSQCAARGCQWPAAAADFRCQKLAALLVSLDGAD